MTVLSTYMKQIQLLSTTVLPEKLFQDAIVDAVSFANMPVPADWARADVGDPNFSRVMWVSLPNIANEIIAWNKVTGILRTAANTLTFTAGAGALPDRIVSAGAGIQNFAQVGGDTRNKFEAGKLLELRATTAGAEDGVFPIVGLDTSVSTNDTILVPNGVLAAGGADAAQIMMLSEPLDPAYANLWYPQQGMLPLSWKASDIFGDSNPDTTPPKYNGYNSIYAESVTGDRGVPTIAVVRFSPTIEAGSYY